MLHPATVKPLIKHGIPLEIKISQSQHNAPTVVGPDIQDSKTVAIGCQPGVAIISEDKPLCSELLSKIEQSGITPWLVNQHQRPQK